MIRRLVRSVAKLLPAGLKRRLQGLEKFGIQQSSVLYVCRKT
jgi:hypothetical protein